MAKLTYFSGNGGFWALDEFEDYTIGALTGNTRTLTFNGTADPFEFAQRVVITYANTTSVPVQGGEFPVQTVVTGGTVASVAYFNQSGTKIAELTGLKGVSAALFDMYIRLDRGFEAFKLATVAGLEVTGSANSRINPADENQWDGDDIRTSTGRDDVKAGGGDDFISDVGGRDKYDGGAGWDTVSYEDTFWNPERGARGISADLTKGTIRGPDGSTDTVKNIEGVRGTFTHDLLKGDKKANDFMGLAGNDTIDGGAGSDWVSYGRDDRVDRGGGIRGVEVELKDGKTKGFALDGFGTRDVLISIENVEGSRLNDRITGNASANHLEGNDGNDMLSGLGGNDRLFGDRGNDSLTGGAGNDTMDGGSGRDEFIFANGSSGADRIDGFEVFTDKLSYAGATVETIDALVDLSFVNGGVLVDFTGGPGTVFVSGIAANSVSVFDLFGFAV